VTPTPEETGTPTPTETPQPTTSPSATPHATPEKKGAPNATIPPNEIREYDSYSTKTRQIIEYSLDLTKQNLNYTYGSADPANGGMDCSGFIYYVLRQNGFPDAPRDSSQQYVWVRKAGNFHAVLSRHEDSFELDALKPGDLLFWTGTYNIERDPPVTHAMVYLGREKRTNKRIMVGASDGRTYDGKQRFGVSIFDFKLSKPPDSHDAKISPVFVGYGPIPGLNED
jgi:cell wall-associated NlpC family hydrolase